jgi:hypothetical protein
VTADIGDYEVDWFLPVVRETLDDLLAAEGFDYIGDYEGVRANWASGPQVLSVGYLPETSPSYELQLSVSEDEQPLQPQIFGNSLGVWRLLPPDRVREIVTNWRFDGPQQLRETLLRAWREAILPYAIPLRDQEGRLAALIAEQDDELREKERRFMDDRLLRFARGQFADGHYDEAVGAYEQLDDERLTAADRKRLDIARRRR